jgi:hypothetical protein
LEIARLKVGASTVRWRISTGVSSKHLPWIWNHDRCYGKKSQQIRRPINRAIRFKNTYTKGVEQSNINVLVTSLNVLAIFKMF